MLCSHSSAASGGVFPHVFPQKYHLKIALYCLMALFQVFPIGRSHLVQGGLIIDKNESSTFNLRRLGCQNIWKGSALSADWDARTLASFSPLTSNRQLPSCFLLTLPRLSQTDEPGFNVRNSHRLPSKVRALHPSSLNAYRRVFSIPGIDQLLSSKFLFAPESTAVSLTESLLRSADFLAKRNRSLMLMKSIVVLAFSGISVFGVFQVLRIMRYYFEQQRQRLLEEEMKLFGEYENPDITVS